MFQPGAKAYERHSADMKKYEAIRCASVPDQTQIMGDLHMIKMRCGMVERQNDVRVPAGCQCL